MNNPILPTTKLAILIRNVGHDENDMRVIQHPTDPTLKLFTTRTPTGFEERVSIEHSDGARACTNDEASVIITLLLAKSRDRRIRFAKFQFEQLESRLIDLEIACDHSKQLALETADRLTFEYPSFIFLRSMIFALERDMFPASSAALLDIFTALRAVNLEDRKASARKTVLFNLRFRE